MALVDARAADPYFCGPSRVMTKAELIDRIARSRDLPPDITKKCIGQILDLAFGELSNYFVRAKVTRAQSPRFNFPGFGTFTKKKRSARRGVNPRTLEPIQIDASYKLDFKPSADLREGMNTGKRPARGEARKRTAGKAKKGAAGGTKRTASKGPRTRKTAAKADSRRRSLTPRDEAAELDALIPDADLFDESLPVAPMQRTRGKSRTSRTGTR